MIEFKRERSGADVATIIDETDQIIEILRRSDGLFDLIIHVRNFETDRWDDMTAVLTPQHFILLGTVADHTLCREPDCPSFKMQPSHSCKCHPRYAAKGLTP